MREISQWVSRRVFLLPVIGLVLLLLVPLFGVSEYSLRQMTLIAVYALVASGLNLSFGFAGQLALGQVAIMAAGAYTTAILTKHGITDLFVVVLATLLVAAIVGLLTGAPALRLSSWALALSSFFLVLLIPGIVEATKSTTGGLDGIVVSGVTLFGAPVNTTESLYLVGIVMLAAWFVVFRNLVESRSGLALRSLRDGEVLVESLGVSSRRLKLSAYVVGTLPAGLGGCLYGLFATYVAPGAFTLTLLVAMIAAAVLAGPNSVYGALFGATVLVLGPLQAQDFQDYSTAIYGLLLLVAGAFLGDGIAGVVRGLFRRFTDTGAAEAGRGGGLDMRLPGETLVADDVSKSFGGLRALDGASVTADSGSVTAIIGPNGAGKTTLLNVISGNLVADSGAVHLGDRPVAGLAPHDAARAGVARTFQTPRTPRGMTALEVVLSGFLRDGSLHRADAILRLPSHRRRSAQERDVAMRLLESIGLSAMANRLAVDLPLGSRRLLEVVRAVAGGPRVILLDEPAAGLDDEALSVLGQLLEQIAASGGTVILVEHNVPFVVAHSHHIVVLDRGSTIATGNAQQISTDERVISSYLGRRTASSLQGDNGTEGDA